RAEVHAIERLILVKTRKYISSLAGYRIMLRLQALRTDLFHHALHRRVDRTNCKMMRLEVYFQYVVACPPYRRHHAVGANGNNTIGIFHANRGRPQTPGSVSFHRLHDIADKRFILWTFRLETRRLITTPNDDVSRRLDICDLVAVN